MTVADVPRMQVPEGSLVEPSAVLVMSCEGYRKGTTGTVIGRRQGCLVFEPDAKQAVARWAHPRRQILVPPSFVAELD